MKKEEFLRQLKEALSGFPADSAEETAEYYREIIEDSMEDGIPEDEAVQALGPVGDIAALVLGDEGRTTTKGSPAYRDAIAASRRSVVSVAPAAGRA